MTERNSEGVSGRETTEQGDRVGAVAIPVSGLVGGAIVGSGLGVVLDDIAMGIAIGLAGGAGSGGVLAAAVHCGDV